MKIHLPFMFLVLLCSCALHTGIVYAQTDEVLDNLSLEDVLNMDISVAAQRSSTLRESPGIVSLITQEDIKSSGAHDLIDVLRLVPGFNFNADVQNFLGISVRGNWANEGKVLVMIDGMPLNDLMFGCVAFGNRVPLALIDRIEIIRGPGSAQYGGIALLGVINILTKNAKQLRGVQFNANAGQFSLANAQRNISLAAGGTFANFDIALSAYYGSALRGTGIYTDYTGAEFDMTKYATLKSKGINIGISSSTTSLRLVIDDYAIGNCDNRIASKFDLGFSSVYGEIKHEETISQRFSITPKISFIHQIPWKVDIEDAKDAGIYYNRDVQRTTGSLGFSYTPFDNTTITGGAEYFNDIGTTPEETREISYFGIDTTLKKTYIAFNTMAFYAQALYNNPIANVTLGARYENNTSFYGAFTPRIAITKQIGLFHAKALFSRAFRSPLIENLSLNPNIQPEVANIAEIEAGYQFTDNFFARTNLYSISIEHPIIYTYDGVFGSYFNASHTGTYGIEGEIQYKTAMLNCVLGYSTYARMASDLENYVVPGIDTKHLGIADYKVTLNTSLHVQEKMWFSFSATGFGERYGYAYDSQIEGRQLQRYAPTVLANATFRMENILSSNVDVRVGVYNLFNASYSFVAPYSSPNGQIFPIPDIPAMFELQLNYRFEVK